ncbi:MAG: lipopolysaccharide kinase InaA family protein [Planctomycetota bacterium]
MQSVPTLPPGFGIHGAVGASAPCLARTVYCLTSLLPELDRLGFLDGTPRRGPTSAVQGRRSHPVYDLESMGPVVWKRCLRGGLMEPLLHDLHTGTRRFFEELSVTEEARSAGASVARILAIALTPVHRGFSRVELLSAYEPDARDGAALVAPDGPDSATQREVLRAAARELRRFHGAGFLHGDLNLKNILWRLSPTGPRITLIDLDPGNARRTGGGNSALENLQRLVRSYLKACTAESWRRPSRNSLTFLNEYFRGDSTGLRDFLRTARRRARLAVLRRPTRALLEYGHRAGRA